MVGWPGLVVMKAGKQRALSPTALASLLYGLKHVTLMREAHFTHISQKKKIKKFERQNTMCTSLLLSCFLSPSYINKFNKLRLEILEGSDISFYLFSMTNCCQQVC